jgi:hypothetical protein
MGLLRTAPKKCKRLLSNSMGFETFGAEEHIVLVSFLTEK